MDKIELAGYGKHCIKYLLFQGLLNYCLPSLRLQTSSPLLPLNLFFCLFVWSLSSSTWDLLFWNKDWTCAPCIGSTELLVCLFFKIFLTWNIFSLYWICYNIASVFVLVFWPQGIWDPSSPTRDWTCTPCVGSQSLNHWTTREVSVIIYIDTFVLVFTIIIHGTISYSQIMGNLKSRENIFVFISFYPRA